VLEASENVRPFLAQPQCGDRYQLACAPSVLLRYGTWCLIAGPFGLNQLTLGRGYGTYCNDPGIFSSARAKAPFLASLCGEHPMVNPFGMGLVRA